MRTAVRFIETVCSPYFRADCSRIGQVGVFSRRLVVAARRCLQFASGVGPPGKVSFPRRQDGEGEGRLTG